MINAAFNHTPKPFSDEKICEGTFVRTFDSKQDNEDFVWHRDLEDRRVQVLEGCGWSFQYDNELPFLINIGDEFFVPKMVYHRIIPGASILRIKVDDMVEEAPKLATA